MLAIGALPDREARIETVCGRLVSGMNEHGSHVPHRRAVWPALPVTSSRTTRFPRDQLFQLASQGLVISEDLPLRFEGFARAFLPWSFLSGELFVKFVGKQIGKCGKVLGADFDFSADRILLDEDLRDRGRFHGLGDDDCVGTRLIPNRHNHSERQRGTDAPRFAITS